MEIIIQIMRNAIKFINNPINFITCISILGIIIIFFTCDKSKINVLGIIKNHLRTLRVFGESKVSISDVGILFILPMFASIILTIHMKIDDTRIGILVTAFTIFIGLLFNILAIIFAFDVVRNKNIDKIILKEVLYNVAFSIIIAIAVIIMSIVMFINLNECLYKILKFILIYFMVVFILTLFMVLKRLFNLLIIKIDNIH